MMLCPSCSSEDAEGDVVKVLDNLMPLSNLECSK